MKVLAFDGSPRNPSSTRLALELVTKELEAQGIETEIIKVGGKGIKGCEACGACGRNKDERCIIDDEVNDWIRRIKESDGILLGSPVHYSGIAADMKAFLDRAFYVQGSNDRLFRHKVGAALVCVRRSGGVDTFDQLNHYLTCSEMLIPCSNYWNVIHGRAAGEIEEDTEGVQTLKILGQNMAWLLKLMENGKGKVEEPEREEKIYMNFIR